MPQLKLSEQEVVRPSSREYHKFVHSRPWKGDLVKAGKSVWPKWPLEEAAGTSSDLNETASGLEFLADVATCFLGKAERRAKDAPPGCGDAGTSEEDACGQKAEVQLESKEASPEGNQEPEEDKDKQTPTENKKRQKPFSIFSDSASSRLPDGFLVEIKFRPGTLEGLGLGPPWMSIWGCCQQCRLIRTMDRRDRVDEFLMEHQSHNSHWKDMGIGHFDFRIEEKIRDLYKTFCDASRNNLLAYSTDDKYIPTKVLDPELHPGLQEKIQHLESLLKSGTETRMELETTAGIYCKRKRLSQSTLEKRAQKKLNQIPNGTAPSAREHQGEDSMLLEDQKAVEIVSQWPQANEHKTVEHMFSPALPQGIHLPFPSFAAEIAQPSSANQISGESLKCADEFDRDDRNAEQPENEIRLPMKTHEDDPSDCQEDFNEPEAPVSSGNQMLAADGTDMGLNLFDWQASVGDNCLRRISEEKIQDDAGEDYQTSSTASMDYPLEARQNPG